MSTYWRPLVPELLSDIASLWGDRPTYTNTEWHAAVTVLSRLLIEGSAVGGVVMRGPQLQAFGVSLFVECDCIDAFLARPTPQFGKSLLLSTHQNCGRDPILDRRRIGLANASNGLDTLIVSANYHRDVENAQLVLGQLIASFIGVHEGYHLSRIVNEVHGSHAVEFAAGLRSFDEHHRFDDVGGVPGLPSVTMTLTRGQAIERKDSLLPVFSYVPPRIGFTEAEQQLLRVARQGWPDNLLADSLGLPLTTIKARWLRIRQRVLLRYPELFASLKGTHSPGARGVQHRHLILEYVRQHPAELTPYAFPPDNGDPR